MVIEDQATSAGASPAVGRTGLSANRHSGMASTGAVPDAEPPSAAETSSMTSSRQRWCGDDAVDECSRVLCPGDERARGRLLAGKLGYRPLMPLCIPWVGRRCALAVGVTVSVWGRYWRR